MLYLILIVAVIVVLVLVFKKKGAAAEDLSGLIQEVNCNIGNFIKLCEKTLIYNHTYSLTIVPVDSTGIWCHKNSDRIEFNVICDIDDDFMLNLFTSSLDETGSKFRLHKQGNDWILTYITNEHFNGDYKKVMLAINNGIKEKYTELNWSFDGSHITWNK